MKKLKENKVLYSIAILVIIWITLNVIAFLVGGILFSWLVLDLGVTHSSNGGYSFDIWAKIPIILFVISIIIIAKTTSIIKNLKSEINKEKIN